MGPEKREHTAGRRLLVKQISDEDHIVSGFGRRAIGKRIARKDLEIYSIGFAVERDGFFGERIDLAGDDRRGARERGGDAGETGILAEIEYAAPGHDVRLVEHVTRQRLPARPGESPERRGEADAGELRLGLAP